MALYIGTVVLIIAFVILFARDRRNPVNAALFLASLTGLYLSAVQISYSSGLTNTHLFLLGVLYALVPILITAFAIFMIVNGVIVRSRERRARRG